MKLPELVYQDESRNNRSCRDNDRYADPYAKCSEPAGKNQQAGNEEQHLPGERKEDRLLRHPDGKEKVCRHHLEPDDRETDEEDTHSLDRQAEQLGIVREGRHRQPGRQLAHQEPGARDARGPDDC